MEITMTQFKDGEQVSLMAKELWETVLSDDESAAMVRKIGLSVFTEFSDPEAYIWINADEVIIGEDAKKESMVKLKMTWEVGNSLYSDNIGLTAAISSGKMKVKGPLLKLMKIVPLLKRAHTIWPDVCKKHNV
jgi:hypothetical protein